MSAPSLHRESTDSLITISFPRVGRLDLHKPVGAVGNEEELLATVFQLMEVPWQLWITLHVLSWKVQTIIRGGYTYIKYVATTLLDILCQFSGWLSLDQLAHTQKYIMFLFFVT